MACYQVFLWKGCIDEVWCSGCWGRYWGPNWVRVLPHLRTLVAVCDHDAERLKNVVERFELDSSSVKIVDKYDAMLHWIWMVFLSLLPPIRMLNWR